MDVTVTKVTATTRRELISGLSRFARSRTPIGLTLFLLDFLQYAAAIVGALLLPSFIRLHHVLRLCRQYDYEGRRWLDFDGVPTTPAVHLHRASGPPVSDPVPSVT